MKKYKDYQVFLIVVISILINYFGKYAADRFQLPLWLDAVGTILSGYCLGPVCGAIVGATANAMYGFGSSIAFFYIITNILTGIMAGRAGWKNTFTNIYEVCSLGSLIAIMSTVISTPLNFWTGGGYTGNM